jgi:hypothetical protein
MTRRTVYLWLALTAACSAQPSADAPAVAPDAGGPPGSGDLQQPPISGGTLLITRDGHWVVAADADSDRVAVVDVGTDPATPKLVADVELARGEEPARLAEDDDGRVHVVLRRGGAIGTIDLASGTQLARRPVCAEPRGIAYDASAASLHVACASGELVSLMPGSGKVTRRVRIEPDLRDVVVVPGGLVVSRFKSAQLIRLDAQGNVLTRIAPGGIERASQDLSKVTTDPLESAVAWRTVSTASGAVFVLHQYGVARPLDLGKDAGAPPAPYRALGSCGGIVAQTVSALTPGGSELEMGMPLPVVALSVDVAVSSDEAWLAVAHPGTRDLDGLGDFSNKVTIYRADALPSLGRAPVRCAERDGRVTVVGQPVALALHPGRRPAEVASSDWLVVQTRSPRQLAFYSGFSGPRVRLALEAPAPDPGHAMFHLDTGSGIACAQCHPEGREDGRVWKFEPIGSRRTQSLDVGLEGTGPYRWDGEFPVLRALVEDNLTNRMGIAAPETAKEVALVRWILDIRPPEPMVGRNDEAALRGRALFESADVGCAQCHAGPTVAQRTNFDVGIEPPHAFQIPSLRGVGYRAPFLHNGCAATLRERFTSPCGGGDRHGRTSQLTNAQIDDLIAYLESL